MNRITQHKRPIGKRLSYLLLIFPLIIAILIASMFFEISALIIGILWIIALPFIKKFSYSVACPYCSKETPVSSPDKYGIQCENCREVIFIKDKTAWAVPVLNDDKGTENMA